MLYILKLIKYILLWCIPLVLGSYIAIENIGLATIFGTVLIWCLLACVHIKVE